MSEVEDIPAAELGNLKARAIAAFLEAQERREAAERAIFEELEEEMFDFLRNTLGLNQGDAAALNYRRDSKATTYRDVEDPSAPSNDITCEVKVDGVLLRCHYIKVQIMGKKSDSFGEEKIYGDEVKFECQNGRGWQGFKSLAALGALLK
jgi:hypothetical protein